MPLALGRQDPNARGNTTNAVTLLPGGIWQIGKGAWSVQTGLYSRIQQYDPVTTIWRNIGTDGPGFHYLNAPDGRTLRVANQGGCFVGAVVTNHGSGYTSAPVVTAAAGGSAWAAIVGGAVNTSVTVTNGGTNYTYAPRVVIDLPASVPGVAATATCTISSGAVNAVTIVNQGAGYQGIPNIYFENDPRDSTGSGAQGALALTGSGQITAVVCTNHGDGSLLAATANFALTFTGGGGSAAAATALGNFSFSDTSAGGLLIIVAGSSYPTSSSAEYIVPVPQPSIVPVWTNPAIELRLVSTRASRTTLPTTAGGAITAGFYVVQDGGCFTGNVPNATGYFVSSGGTTPTPPTIVGGTTGNTETIFVAPV